MTPELYEHLTQLFQAALEIAPDKRAAFLDQISVDDADLRLELESLLAVHEQAALTEKPPADIAAGLFQAQQDGGAADTNALAPNTRLNHYEIRSLLGKGGMGEVYLAEDMRLHRQVALKILPAAVASSQDRMRRFEQEARAAAALNHPHIAHIYEIGQSEGTHFIAIEHIDGDTLRNKIHLDKAPLPKLLKYLNQVAEGLAKAHAAGIVHRDLKPDNIMITRDDYAKILDFGLAKLIEPQRPVESGNAPSSEVDTVIIAQHSLAGTVMGTAGYMSPEQAQGKVKEIDQRSDIFSFGCILFEAVTGQRPFADDSLIKSLHKVVYESAPPIKDFNPSAPPDLQRIVRLCLAKDPDEPYQTIKDVALELKEVRQGMAGAAEIDTTGSSSGSTETWGRQTKAQSAKSASSAEDIVTEIKRHKKSVVIVFAVLVVAFGYGLYKFVSQKRPAASSPAIEMTRLTATGKVTTGSISPDGKQVVYAVKDAGQQSIWVRQVATSSNVQIVPPAEATYANFSFTHDGNYVYFNKREKDGPDSLYKMPALGGMERKVVENFSARAALSSDDKRIAFVRGGFFEQENSLVVANSDGSGEQVLATHKAPLNFYSGGIAWTPDGKSITCVSGPHAQKLIEVSLDGGAEKLVNTPKWFSIINIEWLPDASGLIVAALEQSRTSPLQIWHLSYPGGEARRITNDFSNYPNLSLSADASALVVIKREPTSHIWLVPDGDATRAKQLTTGTSRLDGYPAVSWTPDGRIVYDSTGSGSIHTWIMNAEGSNQRQLTDGRYEDQGAHVSPDGHYIVFASNRTGAQHIYRMDIDGNNLKQLTNGTGEAAPFFSPDGRWVIYSSPSFASWKVPADGGDSVPLTNNSWASDMSPDGKLIAYVRPAVGGPLFWNITIMPFAGGPPLKTFDVTSDSRPYSRWTPDGRAIIYNVTHGGVLSGVTNLWIQWLDGSPPKQLTNFTSESFVSFDWSRDGKQLVCGRGSTSSDVVLISNFR
jgi:serine/threonine protein kinase/Tol biopolymer transport system component